MLVRTVRSGVSISASLSLRSKKWARPRCWPWCIPRAPSWLRLFQRSFDDAAKARIVVLAVVAGFGRPDLATPTDNAPGTPVTRAWSLNGVFKVEAARLMGQDPLAVAKDHTVLLEGERPPGQDRLIGLAPLRRQFRQGDRGLGTDRRHLSGMHHIGA